MAEWALKFGRMGSNLWPNELQCTGRMGSNGSFRMAEWALIEMGTHKSPFGRTNEPNGLECGRMSSNVGRMGSKWARG